MPRKVKTAKDLGKALRDDIDEIEIEGDLVAKVIKIRATGRVAWAVAFAAIGIAALSAYATIGTGGASTPVTGTVTAGLTGAAAGVLGVPAAAAAIGIAVAAGSVGMLTRLRKYKEISRSGESLILRKR